MRPVSGNRRSNKRLQRGATLLESALVLLTFILMLLGTIDFGQVLYFHQSLVERARAAARYGATDPTNTTAIKNMAVYGSTSASGSPLLPGLTTAMVSVQNPDANTTSARIVVTISGYPLRFFTPYLAQSFNNRPVTVAMASETQVP
jgi:Flp pilus assembly protein TadG